MELSSQLWFVLFALTPWFLGRIVSEKDSPTNILVDDATDGQLGQITLSEDSVHENI